jgi:hypothetical protein
MFACVFDCVCLWLMGSRAPQRHGDGGAEWCEARVVDCDGAGRPGYRYDGRAPASEGSAADRRRVPGGAALGIAIGAVVLGAAGAVGAAVQALVNGSGKTRREVYRNLADVPAHLRRAAIERDSQRRRQKNVRDFGLAGGTAALAGGYGALVRSQFKGPTGSYRQHCERYALGTAGVGALVASALAIADAARDMRKRAAKQRSADALLASGRPIPLGAVLRECPLDDSDANRCHRGTACRHRLEAPPAPAAAAAAAAAPAAPAVPSGGERP